MGDILIMLRRRCRLMAPPKKFKGDTVMFSYRTDAEIWRVFSAIATLRGETPTEIFKVCVDRYIDEHKGQLGTTFNDLAKAE
jgi:hypothetical protein